MKYTKITLISLIICLFIVSNILAYKSFKKAEAITENREEKEAISDIMSSFISIKEQIELESKSGNENENENENEISSLLNKPKKSDSNTRVRKASNNVYLHTVRFYIYLLKGINDARTPRDIASAVVSNCPKLNIFDTIREDLINCRTLQRKLDNKNRNIVKDFRVGCMKNILTNIRGKCSVLKQSNANKIYSSALNVLNNLTRKKQVNLRYTGYRFIKRFSIYLKVNEAFVDRRLKIMKVFEEKRKKLEAKKRKAKKGKKKFFLEISSNMLNQYSNSNSNSNNFDRKKKGKNPVRNNLGIVLPSNNPYDKLFLKETNLSANKVNTLARYLVKVIQKINRV